MYMPLSFIHNCKCCSVAAARFLSDLLKGDISRFFIFIANSFYMSDFMYLLITQFIFHNVQ